MWLWLIIAIILLAISTYCIGRFQLELDGDVVGLFWICFIGCLLWPLSLPVIGMYMLGKRFNKEK